MKWARKADCFSSFQKCGEELTKIFYPVNLESEATHSLLNLSQGNHPVIDCIIDFRTAAADSGWNETALLNAFCQGLSNWLKDALTSHDHPKSVNSFIELLLGLTDIFENDNLKDPDLFALGILSHSPFIQSPFNAQ